MTTRATFRSAVETFYEDLTFETVMSMAPLQFGDDFIGAGHGAGIPAAGAPVAGYHWVKKIVGAAPPSVALLNNAGGGQIQCALTATNEAEEAALYWNDSLAIDVTKITSFEARAQLLTPPSAAGVQVGIGLGTAWVGGPTNLARYLFFGFASNNTLLIQSKDGVGAVNSFPAAPIGGSAITLDTAMHVFRISCESVADIAFYLDGNRVNPVGSVAFQASGANAILQPWFTVSKPGGTGLAMLNVDKIDIFSNR